MSTALPTTKKRQYLDMSPEEVLVVQEAIGADTSNYLLEIVGSIFLLCLIALQILLELIREAPLLSLLSAIIFIALVASFLQKYRKRNRLRKEMIHRQKYLSRVKLTKKERKRAPDFYLIYLADRNLPIIVEEDFYNSVDRGELFDIWRSRYTGLPLTKTISNRKGDTTSVNRVLTMTDAHQAQQEWYNRQANKR